MKRFTSAKPFHARRLSCVAAALLAGVSFGLADDQANWPRWRGPRDNGSVESGTYPAKFEKVLWKAPLPGKGCSTPVVWDQRIYLTAPMNGLDAVLAFDWSGKPLWHTTLGPEQAGKHRSEFYYLLKKYGISPADFREESGA